MKVLSEGAGNPSARHTWVTRGAVRDRFLLRGAWNSRCARARGNQAKQLESDFPLTACVSRQQRVGHGWTEEPQKSASSSACLPTPVPAVWWSGVPPDSPNYTNYTSRSFEPEDCVCTYLHVCVQVFVLSVLYLTFLVYLRLGFFKIAFVHFVKIMIISLLGVVAGVSTCTLHVWLWRPFKILF